MKHKKLEYGFIGNEFKVYDYADCELDWSLDNPEDLFLQDLKICNKDNGI